MEDDLKKKLKTEDNLKKLKMEDNLIFLLKNQNDNLNQNGRRPQQKWKTCSKQKEDDLKIIISLKGRRPQFFFKNRGKKTSSTI